MTVHLANEIAAARQRFREGVRHCGPLSETRTRAIALTDLLWANLPEIEAALRFAPSDWANLQRAAAAMTPDGTTDADKLRGIADRRRLGLMSWERATLEAIADKLDTRAKDSAEHAAAVAERVGTAEDPTT